MESDTIVASPVMETSVANDGVLSQDGPVLTSLSESNGGAPNQLPRLASITGLLINQKVQKWNSNTDQQARNEESPSPKSSVSTEPGQTPQLTRTIRFEDDGEPRRTASFGTVTSMMLSRRAAVSASVNAASTNDEKKSGKLTESDLRRVVFQHSRSKRLVSGLRVHAFTRQAFISSFTVGLALGSIMAIALKILIDLICRMVYS